jgi:hypothetical protein
MSKDSELPVISSVGVEGEEQENELVELALLGAVDSQKQHSKNELGESFLFAR